jgi:hypothetical protein
MRFSCQWSKKDMCMNGPLIWKQTYTWVAFLIDWLLNSQSATTCSKNLRCLQMTHCTPHSYQFIWSIGQTCNLGGGGGLENMGWKFWWILACLGEKTLLNLEVNQSFKVGSAANIDCGKHKNLTFFSFIFWVFCRCIRNPQGGLQGWQTQIMSGRFLCWRRTGRL